MQENNNGSEELKMEYKKALKQNVIFVVALVSLAVVITILIVKKR